MGMFFRLCLAVVAILLPLSAQAQVSTSVSTGHAKSRLAAETMAAVPGDTITVALLQELEDHWHTYWQNPGDSGLPLMMDWTLPDGYVAENVLYPLPHRIPLGPLINYGHEGNPIFLFDIEVPKSAVPGTSIPIKVKASWLICAEICVPESAELRMLLPIAAHTSGPTIGYADKIIAARAALPKSAPFTARFYDLGAGPVLEVQGGPSGAWEFYPYAPSLIEPSAEVIETVTGTRRALQFSAGYTYSAARPKALQGVLVVIDDARTGYTLSAPFEGAPIDPIAAVASGEGVASSRGISSSSINANVATPLLLTLVFAFFGGVILNIMPCVFPIIFLKAAGFAALPRDQRGTIRKHGVLYTLGVLSAFASLAALLLILRAGGEQLGWGFHLQSPITVSFFALMMFVIGLNLAGVFEFGQSVQGVGGTLAERGGAFGAFFTGLLAVAVAAPCIGPFMGGAVGVALGQSPLIGILIFLMIGLGLAMPYLLISLFPALGQVLPKPGLWLVVVKQLFSFAMFATVVWLVWVVSTQSGSTGVLRAGTGLLLAGFAAWAWGQAQSRTSSIAFRAAALTAIIGAGSVLVGIQAVARPITLDLERREVAYSEQALADYRAAGTPVFVDFTASWCVSCQVNKMTVLKTTKVREAFAAKNVIYMIADWTLRDEEITAALEAQGRAGVPLYLYYAPNATAPNVLPALLTIDMVTSLITP